MTEEQLAVSSVLTVKESRSVVIWVRDLYEIYRVGDIKVRALDELDFDICKGEFVAIVGASGSSKSTPLNVLAGLEKSTEGGIKIGRVHIEKMTERRLANFRRKEVGSIFQIYNPLDTMDALENVALSLSFRDVSRRQRFKEARKYMDLIDVGGQARHILNQISGGRQQRVEVARTLVVNLQIILADEPTGNLDSKTIMGVPRLMRKIVREQDQILVMVAHDNNLASYADRRVRIMNSRIVGIGTGGGEVLYEGDAEEGECNESESKQTVQGPDGVPGSLNAGRDMPFRRSGR